MPKIKLFIKPYYFILILLASMCSQEDKVTRVVVGSFRTDLIFIRSTWVVVDDATENI